MAALIPCRACGNQIGLLQSAMVALVVVGAIACEDRDPTRARAQLVEPQAASAPVGAPVTQAQPAQPTVPVASAPPAAPAAPDINVSAEQLRRDYDGNEVSADEKYRNKMLVVTGIVTAVKKDPFGKPYVMLATGSMFESVHARFATDRASDLRSFLRGDKVIMRCVGNNVVLGSPQLKDCVLQHHYRRMATPASE